VPLDQSSTSRLRVGRTLVATGRGSAEQVAAALDISRRTLAHRVKAGGTNFRKLLGLSLFIEPR
jgi:hypothetical protein